MNLIHKITPQEVPRKFPKIFLFSLIFVLILIGSFIISRIADYNIFHIPVEFFSIFVAWMIFIIAWNSRRFSDNTFFLFIGISFLFIGAIDFIHTLTYKGLFIDFSNWATQTWITARYIQSISFLVSILFINRKVKLKATYLVYFIISSISLIAIFTGIFPQCYNDVQQQLTPFKIYSEYLIISILIFTIILFYRKRREFDRFIIQMIILAMIITVISEYSFTLYQDVTGLANLIGHLLKIVSFYCIYKALVEISLNRPYDFLFRSLTKSEQKFRRIFENSPVALKEEDLSEIKKLIDELRERGIHNFREYFEDNPKKIRKFAPLVKAISVNKAYLDLYKAKNEGVFAKGLQNIFTEESYDAFKEEIIALAEGKTYFETEAITHDLNEVKNHIHLRLSIVPGHEHNFSKVLVSVLDITDRIEFENLRRQFVYTVSHELRTPISVISQSLSNLQKYKEKLTLEQEDKLMNSLSRNATLLSEIIEDLLIVSRIDREVIRINWFSYNLLDVIEDVLEQLDPHRKAKQILIKQEVDPSIQLFGDPMRIAQILRIFIDNAIKYSNKQTKVEIKAEDHYQGEYNPIAIDGVLIRISDEGRGIREEEIPNIFQRFFRAEDVSDIPGTGLGLSIARELAEMHQGTTYVRSTFGKGSTFFVFLPRLKEAPLA